MLQAAPTGQQTMNQREVDAFLQEARTAPKTKSPRILGINMLAMMKAKNDGYPKDMYHASHEMRQALKEEEEIALATIGYQLQYIPRAYPKAMFRRNMAPKFEPQFDPATGIPTNNPFVEERTARTEQDEKTLRAMKPGKGQSAWFERFTDLPEIEDGPSEDPAVTIARQAGELEALRAQAAGINAAPAKPGK